MASALRFPPPDLDDALSRLRAAPWRFDVWQAAAILEAWKGKMDWSVPASDTFPASAVRDVLVPEEGPPRLEVAFLGLAGIDGPLPPPVAAAVRVQTRAGDPAFQDFLDLFQNRLLHVWREEASSLCPELRADCPPEEHSFAVFLDALSGLPHCGELARDMPMPGPLSGRGVVHAALFRSHAAIWGRQPHTAAGLEKLVKSAFGVEARVEAFRGAWLDLAMEDRTRLGGKDPGKARLGESALLGRRIFDASAGVTLHLGPLTEAQRRDFLPPPAGRRRADLLALIRWYLGEGVEYEIVLSR